jgi:carboxylate-amine ligase
VSAPTGSAAPAPLPPAAAAPSDHPVPAHVPPPATAPVPPGARVVRTVGVEEELLLIDAETLQPAPVAGDIIRGPGSVDGGDAAAVTARTAAGLVPGALLELEVKHEQIEVVSPPLRTLDELREAVLSGRRAADRAAREVGARAVAVATSTVPCTPHAVPGPRYDRMIERYGLTMTEQLTCGFHVHVAVASDEEGVAVLDRIRPWLPVILALSANSPFWQGGDTAFASYRYQAWGRWPSSGAYDAHGSAARYAAWLGEMLAADVSLDVGMVYSDARLSAHSPTVETRIADVCLLPEDAAVIAVLVRALVETAAAEWRAGIPADDVPTALLRLAAWRASRSGLDDDLLHPVTRRPCRAADAVAALREHVRDGFADDAERRAVAEGLAAVLARGNGAARQREIMARAGSCEAVLAEIADATLGIA